MREPVSTTRAPSSRRRGAVVGVAITLVAVAIPVGLALVDGDRDRGSAKHEDGESDAHRAVLAALDTTVAAGSYDTRSELDVEPGAAGMRRVGVQSHGTVNLDPYRLRAVSEVTGLGAITLYANDTTVWQTGGGNYGAVGGAPLSGFADLVEGTLGPGQGALAMMSIASPNGYLSLEREAVLGAEESGTGTVDGVAVTYYDVIVDVSRMADAPALTVEQRATIGRAVAVLQRAGYTGTEERLGIDGLGYIREVTATTHFADGSSLRRHTVFSNFGCADEIALPGEPAPAPRTEPCTTPPASTATTAPPTTTTLAPVTTTTSPPDTTAPATTTTTEPPVTTTSPPQTTTTSTPATTTSAPPTTN